MLDPGAVDRLRDAASVQVLVVDDYPPFRLLLRELVATLPTWRVVGEASSGEDAVRAAGARDLDVVLMDINLPGMTGIEATRRIVSAAPSVRVILLSTYSGDDLQPDVLRCGAVAYVNKADLTAEGLLQVMG